MVRLRRTGIGPATGGIQEFPLPCVGELLRMSYLGGGTSAPQNLQRTLSSLLLAGTTWFLLHLGHVRLRKKIAHAIAAIGFINLPLFPHAYSTCRRMTFLV
jgi:hypothetical protein